MRRVVILSPYSGNVERNLAYLHALILDSLERGEAPFAGHAIYPLVLDDSDPDQRRRGMLAFQAWIASVRTVIVGVDLGITDGMRDDLEVAKRTAFLIEDRSLPGWKS